MAATIIGRPDNIRMVSSSLEIPVAHNVNIISGEATTKLPQAIHMAREGIINKTKVIKEMVRGVRIGVIVVASYLKLHCGTTEIRCEEDQLSAKHQLAVKGLSECKASESNFRCIQVKYIVKEVKDYLKTYSSAEMDISWRETQYHLKA
ncbi:hypothetical protein Tco_1367566 [Tanacetum coccineum]